MGFKLRLYVGEQIKDVALKDNSANVTIGSASTDTICIRCSEIIANHLNFIYINGAWVCQNYATRESKKIADGDIFVLSMDRRIAVMVCSDDIVAKSLELRPNSRIIIGRNVDCMFYLPDRSVGRRHAEIMVDEIGARLRDLNSLNGTYVNNRKVSEVSLKKGDIISIGKYNIRYQKSVIEVCTEEPQKQEKKKNSQYPVFSLSPRLRHQAPSEIIEIKAPPSIGNMPMVNWLSFLPMLATRSVYSAVFPLASVFSTFLEKKKYKEAKEVRQEKYEKYLEEVKAQIDKNREDQFLSLEESNHNTNQCFEIATRRARTLWERSPEDDDFMKVRIGKGDVQTSFRIKFPDSVLKLYNDELENQGEELGKGNQILEGAPILCDLAGDVSVGIIGNREKALTVARNMIVQLSTTHSYKDLKIVTLFSGRKEAQEWEFAKWLPHAFNDSREIRYVANDVFKTASLDKILDEELKNRKQMDKENLAKGQGAQPFFMFVVSDPELIEETEIENYLDYAEPGMGIGVIYVYEELKDLPKSCNVIVNVSSVGNEVFHKSNIGKKQLFEMDNFSRTKAELFARSLAPVRLAEKKGETDMPSSITFLEGYGVKRVEELPVWKNWNSTNPAKSMAVPLGVKSNGEPFIFNMMYGSDFLRYHGSHGLLAGTNGSGKSEMLQSWILSMALRFPPNEVSFVIIDYKGTGLLRPFEKLPHLAGKFSNIDGNVRRNIISINEEMKRRQLLFDRVGIHPEIKEYFEKGYHKTIQPLPVIVLVIDEFAEITKNLPDMVPVLESIFALGRSLGIWAIVSTQKPTGVVTSKMYANSKFRWCCRVASSSDSKEMLHHTHAAKIRNAGRAFIQVGEDDVYEQVQSYWSGAPYMPERTEKSSADLPISMVDITGKRIQYEYDFTEKSVSAVKEIDAVVAHIAAVAKEHGVESARQLWKKPLPRKIFLEDHVSEKDPEDFVVTYGMVDNPYLQTQYPVALNFSRDGHCLVYGLPGSGKTTFLQTCIMSIAKRYRPDEVNLYGLDFGSWSLNLFAKLPHMCGVANDSDKEQVDRLIDVITKEMDIRKKAFAMNGMINIKSYNQFMEEKYPYIVLLIDNFASVFAMYPTLSDFFVRLSREGANYGIYILATTTAVSGINFKVTASIKKGIALQMKSDSDYTTIVGKTNGLMPSDLEGRGLVREDMRVLEFQTALPAYGEDEQMQLDNLKNQIETLAEKYADVPVKKLSVMEKEVKSDAAWSDKVVLGIRKKDGALVEYDITKMPHYIVISGEDSSDANKIMKNIVAEFRQKLNANVAVYDNRTFKLRSLKENGCGYISSVAELDEYFEQLSVEIDKRKKQMQEWDCEFEPMLLVIQGYKQMYEDITNDSARKLAKIVDGCSEYKICLLVSDCPKNLGKVRTKEYAMRMMLGTGPVLFVGGDYFSHLDLPGDEEYSAGKKPLEAMEGYLLFDGSAQRFQAIE